MYSSASASASASSNNNLTRYGSAPASSFISSVAESVSGLDPGLHQHQQRKFFSNANESRNTLTLLPDSYGISNNNHNSPVKTTSSSSPSNLIRHSSSPAGFLNHLTSQIGGGPSGYGSGPNYQQGGPYGGSVLGYCSSKGTENYDNNHGGSVSGHNNLSRLGSQLSFTKQEHHSLSQISEINEATLMDGMASHDTNNLKRASSSRSSSGFSLSAWEDNNDGFSFSGPSNKRNININDDILNGLASMESQDIAFDMTSMDRLMHIPQDSVPCKVRAKRGFATHPRSIAERERRTRISGKLKKLQDLVPNMDKQTSYADMLDLAVQHIKGLQNEIQKLNSEVERCSCGCKQNMQK